MRPTSKLGVLCHELQRQVILLWPNLSFSKMEVWLCIVQEIAVISGTGRLARSPEQRSTAFGRWLCFPLNFPCPWYSINHAKPHSSSPFPPSEMLRWCSHYRTSNYALVLFNFPPCTKLRWVFRSWTNILDLLAFLPEQGIIVPPAQFYISFTWKCLDSLLAIFRSY